MTGLHANFHMWRFEPLRCLVSITASVRCGVLSLMSAYGLAGFVAPPTMAQVAQTSLAPITLPSLYPTDVTPPPIGREQELFHPGPTYYLLQKLPKRLWFNFSVEETQRYESNVLSRAHRGSSDYVFRSLPNITLGYNIAKNTSIYTNYFVIKDVFARNTKLTFPTNQSLSLGLRHEVSLGAKSTLQFDFQARELWQLPNLRQADLLPGVTYTRVISPSTVAFANIILQLRGKDYFVAPTREIDPFYSVGFVKSFGQWALTGAGTLVTNFRHPPFSDSIPPVSNNAMIVDLELSHPVVRKLPNLVAFGRVEPIWNWDSKAYPGISGFDFRFFSGLRYTLVKPSYYSQMEKLRRQLKDAGSLPVRGNQSKKGNVQNSPAPGNTPAPGEQAVPGNTPASESMPVPGSSTPASGSMPVPGSTSVPGSSTPAPGSTAVPGSSTPAPVSTPTPGSMSVPSSMPAPGSMSAPSSSSS